MYLKSIELSGFKSFAKKSNFAFNTPISAIIGPNGSGKSNVAEAFRFVLGEQSIKSLRGKRGEDLIWNGSGELPRSNRANVRVVFDNERKIFDLDFQEVMIERAVHRDGVNEYLINGSPVRLKDILELLAKAHIGSSGHHIISQGEADKIIGATAKDRKAIVEDALGLKIYQYKRAESEKKLEKTFENIAQVNALRKEIAPHLRFLKKQVEKFEKMEGLRVELLELMRELTKREGEQGNDFAGISKNELLRELGQVEGLIMAEEKYGVREEHVSVNLKEIEDLYQEISFWQEAAKILTRIKNFIQSKRHVSDRAHEDLSVLKQRKEKLEEAIRKTESNEGLKKDIERLKIRLEDAEVAGGEEVLKEFRETSERDEFLARELGDLEKSAESLKSLIKDLEKRLANEFEQGLGNINKEFSKLFSKMFGGGKAELVLEKGRTLDTDSQGSTLESEEGLEIKINLPRKKVRSLIMLSGGERALASIALIFAISSVNPPPFIILDETDAALDEANSKKYGDLVEELSKHSQLILITHNRETMSRAGIIYGVTMAGSGISKVLSISFAEAVEVAK